MSFRFIDKLLFKGKGSLAPVYIRRSTLLNRYGAVSIAICAIFMLQYMFLGYFSLGLSLLPVMLLFMGAVWANKEGYSFVATNLLLSTAIFALLFFVLITGKNHGAHLLYFPVAFVAISLVPIEKKACLLLYLGLIVFAFLCVEIFVPDTYSRITFTPLVQRFDYMFTAVISLLSAVFAGYNLLTVNYNIKGSLLHSQSQNKALLKGIPDQILLFNLEGICLNFKGRHQEDAGDIRFIGHPISHFLSAALCKKLLETARHVILTGKISNFEWESVSYGDRNYHEFRVTRLSEREVITIIRDVTDNKQQQADKKAKELAENAVRTKSEFLSSMSHEIRTPMNIILGLSRLLLKDEAIEGKSRENVEAITFSAENLLVVVNDILDLSKIEAGKFSINHSQFNLKKLLAKHVNFMQHESAGKQLKLELEIDENVPDLLIGDPVRINQIMTNLTGNAIKYTRKGTVKVRLSLDSLQDGEAQLCFSVKDTGIGIPQDKLHYIFDSFSQISHSDEFIAGTGLGLTISQKLVNLLGGNRIEVKSVIGLGSTFSFVLPFRVIDGEDKELGSQVNPQALPDMKGVKVLLAEDNSMNQFYAKQLLGSWNIEVVLAANGLEVVELVDKELFDLILMDLQMPMMDGFRALEQIRTGKGLNVKTPVVCVSADVFPETRTKALESGMNDFLTKPLDEDALFRVIKKFVKKVRPKVCNTLKMEVAKSQQLLKLENISPIITSDHETLLEFLNLFVSSAQEDLDKLSTAIILMEHENIKAYAHKIKSSFRNVGAFASADILQSIEKKALKEAGQQEMAALLRELINHYKIIKTEIEQRIPKIA